MTVLYLRCRRQCGSECLLMGTAGGPSAIALMSNVQVSHRHLVAHCDNKDAELVGTPAWSCWLISCSYHSPKHHCTFQVSQFPKGSHTIIWKPCETFPVVPNIGIHVILHANRSLLRCFPPIVSILNPARMLCCDCNLFLPFLPSATIFVIIFSNLISIIFTPS